jgi:hypothetical protein
VPKEQPPRKLSGNRTDIDTKTLESGTISVPAEGIAISGAKDRGGITRESCCFSVHVVPQDIEHI